MMKLPRVAVLASALIVPAAYGADLVVAAPIELAECAEALKSAFLADETDTRLRFVMDASDELYVKVSADEPIDVYMSSDMRLQGQLLADGKMVYDSWTTYATGRIVLWSMDKRFDIRKGIPLLADPAVKKLAIVNAGNAYLMPTYAALHYSGLLDKMQPRSLEFDTMQEVVKAVRTNKAQLAILSYETVLSAAMKGVGSYYLIPEREYQDSVPGHAAVVTLHGKANTAAYRFIRFLKSAKAQAAFVPKGFMKPPLKSVDVR